MKGESKMETSLRLSRCLNINKSFRFYFILFALYEVVVTFFSFNIPTLFLVQLIFCSEAPCLWGISASICLFLSLISIIATLFDAWSFRKTNV